MLVVNMAFIAMGMDITSEKISNRGILVFALIGFGYQLITLGLEGWWWYLSGAAIAYFDELLWSELGDYVREMIRKEK